MCSPIPSFSRRENVFWRKRTAETSRSLQHLNTIRSQLACTSCLATCLVSTWISALQTTRCIATGFAKTTFILRAHSLPLYGPFYFPRFYEIRKGWARISEQITSVADDDQIDDIMQKQMHMWVEFPSCFRPCEFMTLLVFLAVPWTWSLASLHSVMNTWSVKQFAWCWTRCAQAMLQCLEGSLPSRTRFQHRLELPSPSI